VDEERGTEGKDMKAVSYYCPEHEYNPPENSGFALCPQCEIAAPVSPELRDCDCGRRVDPDRGCVGCNQHPLDCGCLPVGYGEFTAKLDEIDRSEKDLNKLLSRSH